MQQLNKLFPSFCSSNPLLFHLTDSPVPKGALSFMHISQNIYSYLIILLASKNAVKTVDIVYNSVHKLILRPFGAVSMWITISDFRLEKNRIQINPKSLVIIHNFPRE